MKVTKEIEKLEKSAVKLTVTVAKENVTESYNETLSQYVKQVQIPGFRKGKVPSSVLERKYGEQIKAESIGSIIDKALQEIFADEKEADIKPLPYAQPVLQEMPELDVSKDLKFTVTYDVFPKVEVKEFSGIEVKEPQVTLGDTEIEEELKGLQERNAVVIDKKDETVAKDSIVTLDIVEKDDAGNDVAGTKRDGFVFTVGTAENTYKIDDEITGMKKDESKEISKTYAADDSNPEFAGKTKKYSVTVKAVKVRDLPKLDDDFAQDVNEKFKTLDELKADIKKQLNTAKERKIEEIKINSLLEQLIEKNAFEVPETMIKAELEGRWNMMARQWQISSAELEKLLKSSGRSKDDMLKEQAPEAEKVIKSRIIVDSLLKERNITITPEELDAKFQEIADQNGITLEEVKKHYEDPRAKEYLIDDAKDNKLYAELFKQVKVSKGDEVKFADLFKNA